MTMVGLRRFEEKQAIGGAILPLVARLAPRGPRARAVAAAPPVAPQRAARVSVVIPCYNYGRFLSAAVESALAQRGVDVEVIIVDDRSTDDSRDVAARLAEEHSQVRVIENGENSGHVRSFNAGWAASTGEYIVKLDADDLLAPDALTRAAALFEAHPSVTMVYGHPRHFDTERPPGARVDRVRWTIWDGRDWLAERCRLGVSVITNPEMVLRATLLHESGPMDPRVPYAPDMEISLRAAALGDIGYIGGADQAFHREHAGSMSETDGAGIRVDLDARRSAFDIALAAVPDAALGERLRDEARRSLAGDAVRHAAAAADRGGEHVDLSGLLAFARETYPAIVGDRLYRALAADARPTRPRAGAMLRRVRRRARSEGYFCRWMVSGV